MLHSCTLIPQHLPVMIHAQQLKPPKRPRIYWHTFNHQKFLEPGLKEWHSPHTTQPAHGGGEREEGSHCSNVQNNNNNNNTYQPRVPTIVQLADENKINCDSIQTLCHYWNKPVYIYTNMSIPGPAANHCLRNGLNHMHAMECPSDHKISHSSEISSLWNIAPLVTQLSTYFIVTKLNYSRQ